MQPKSFIDSRPRLQRVPASFGLVALFLLVGPAVVAACGDDGNVVGSDGDAGSSGMTSGGNDTAGKSSAAGAANAGTSTHGGMTSMGGTTGGSNHAGSGGASCETGECLRANVCLDKCGGNLVYTGCCECPANTVEETSCMAAGGQGSGGQGSSDCVGMTCGAGQTCVAYRTVGGAVFPPDTGGTCMAGKHLEGNMCQNDFAYTCAALTGCSAPAATCHCAPNTKCANANACKLPYQASWLDTSADLVCEQQAP